MRPNILIGILAGAAAGVAIALLVKKKDCDSFSEEGFEENQMLDKVNDFLSKAKSEAMGLLQKAEMESTTILEEAAKILSTAKEKVATIHNEVKDSKPEEIDIIKNEVEKSIEEFRKKMK